MNEEQCNEVTVGFLDALGESKELRDRWVTIARNEDWKALRELIAQTLDLDRTPSEEDLEEMHSLAERHHSKKCIDLEEIDARIEPAFVFNGRPGGA